MKHLLNFKNTEKQELEKLIDTTLKIETNNSEKINSYALMKFDEGSTRTRLSFSLAAKKSGIEIVEITDLISAKSKGEDLQHEIETYKALGIEILVIRTKENNFQDYENINDLSVISAGFGNSSHPTQAIIDVATLEKFKKFNRDIPVTYVGDLKHSRVFASGRELLGKLGFKVGVYASDELLPDDLSNLQIYNSWEEVVSETGAIELLRVQKERIEDIQEFNFEQYIKQFQISKQILDNSPDDLIVLHPMPINIGIEISEEASLHNKFKYQEQLRLGIASRIASYKFALELI
jgi:aspartate carbamoyltransferase catalytic subunit